MKGDMINDMIDKALVSMLTRGLKKFTANDVQAETTRLGYNTPSRPYINHCLQERAKSNLVKLVTDLPMVWEFVEDNDRVRTTMEWLDRE